MTITNEKNGNQMTVGIEGRLDTTTVPQLESFLNDNTAGITDIVLDLEKLEYISSAGLRVVLSLHKKMCRIGSLKLINASDEVMEVFDITGFSDILTIE